MATHKDGSMKRGSDGLTKRQREFVRLRRADPHTAGWILCKKAGYKGQRASLDNQHYELTHDKRILAALYVPEPLDEISDEDLKKEIKQRLVKIIRSTGASDSDAIKAADKLLATIPGGFVPLQVNNTNKITLESLVMMGGGAPAHALSAPSDSEGQDE